MSELDATHDPARRSWVESANDPETEFPIQNLPFGAFTVGGDPARIGVAIGDAILDVTQLEAEGLLRPGGERTVFGAGALNPFMALPPGAWRATRRKIADLLDADAETSTDQRTRVAQALVRMGAARMHLPFCVSSFTDFYSSREHATNVGAIFRGRENALMPNWLHLPVGYNGRASTVVVSGTEVLRPMGQINSPDETAPRFAPTEKLDFELELGAIIGTPTAMGAAWSSIALAGHRAPIWRGASSRL